MTLDDWVKALLEEAPELTSAQVELIRRVLN